MLKKGNKSTTGTDLGEAKSVPVVNKVNKAKRFIFRRW